MYPFLELGNLSIPMYGLMVSIGIIAALVVGYFFVYKPEGISNSTLLRIMLCCLFGGFAAWLGAVFFDALFHTIETGIIGIYGITYLGGFVTAIPVGVLCFHKFVPVAKGRALYLMSLLIPLIVLAHAFGRIGCFFGGCCYGRPTDSWIGVVFPKGSDAAFMYPASDGRSLPVIPTMLVESAFEFILFGFMMGFRKKVKGHELELYLITYSIFRFIIEFYRGDSRGATGLFISPAQLLDIICLVAGILIVLFYKQKVFKTMYKKCEYWQEEVIKNAKKILSTYKDPTLPEARIEELYKIMKKGIITEEEFNKKKQKLLEKI